MADKDSQPNLQGEKDNQIDRLVNTDGTSKPHAFEPSGEGAFCICGWVEDSPEGNHVRPVESRLTAEEKELFQAILRVIDDGKRGDYWKFYLGHHSGPTNPTQSDLDRERLDFADAVIDTWRKFKLKT